MRILKNLAMLCIVVYLGIGIVFATMPFAFGSFKVAAMMLVGWPLVFMR